MVSTKKTTRMLHNTMTPIIGVIPIQYTSEDLFAKLKHKEWYETVKQYKNENRKKEWLTARYLIYLLLEEEKEIKYTSTGKPQLADNSYHLSISHSKEYVAVGLNKTKEVAIDIECISPRVKKIKDRFLSEKEKQHISTENELLHLLLHWSAKESLFKLLGYDDIEFNSQLHIDSFTPQLYKWSHLKAFETRSGNDNHFIIDYLVTRDYVVTTVNLTQKRLSL